ncbi:MAG: hypothetical protein B7Y25_08475 [Alphaproteobacteria bacterium 16-39-46]|nr:MAG: hypothetical protein B7Y25_08475 [Alphaproteobacteria bacterium 16-39-46]
MPSFSPMRKGRIDPKVKGAHFISYCQEGGMDYHLESLGVPSTTSSQNEAQFLDDFLGEPFEEVINRGLKSNFLFKEDKILRPGIIHTGSGTNCNVDDLIDNEGIWASGGWITFSAHSITLKNTLLKSPVGVKIQPNNDDSWFQEIYIYPNKFIYKSLRSGEMCQSETCCLSGTIDFRTGKVDLEVLNGFMDITFHPKKLDQDLPYRLDSPQSKIQELIFGEILEMERVHSEGQEKELFDEAVLTATLFLQTKNLRYGSMALTMFERVTQNDSDEERRGVAFHSIEETKRQLSVEVYKEGLAFRDDPHDTNHTKAIQYFLEAIELQENNVKAMHNVAMLYWKLKDYKGAELWFNKAAELDFEPSRRNLVKMQEEAKI